MKTTFLMVLCTTVAWSRHVPLFDTTNLENPGNVGTKIVNGQNALPGQFPYMAALMLARSELVYRCGAVVIDDEWVLTTSRCSGEAGNIYDAFLGVHDFKNMSASQPDKPVFTEIYRYPGYDWGPRNDLALLRMHQPINPDNPFIRSIAIAPDNGDDYVGAPCFTMGFGKQFAGDPSDLGALRYISTDVISDAECKERSDYDITTNVCTYTGYNGPCTGDEGSPLVCVRNGISYVVGVLHYVNELCYPTEPSIFTRISLYNSWIRSIIDA